MKKFLTFMLAAALLCACAVPAGAVKYAPDAPEGKTPGVFTQAQEDFEANEAVRLGLAPAGLQDEYDKTVTRLEFVEVLMNTVAAHWGYDLKNFAAACAVNPPVKLVAEYKSGVFSDVGGDTSLDWAYALGLVSGTGNGRFEPNAAVTAAVADKFLANAAALCGVSAVTSGASVNCTRGVCLSACYRLYNAAGKAAKPLLSYEDEVKRLEDAFGASVEKYEYDVGTVLYGNRNGLPALCVVYVDGGARTIPLPSASLSYIDPHNYYVGLILVYGADGLEYEMNLRTGESVPVATDDPMSFVIVPAGEEPSTTPASAPAENAFGHRAQDVTMINNMAPPHTVGNGYMPIYTNNGGTWKLWESDMAVVKIAAERAEAYPAGQVIQVGYIHNGEAVEVLRTSLLGELTFTFRAPETGEYQFYILNGSLSTMYITSVKLETLHREGWENIQFSH